MPESKSKPKRRWWRFGKYLLQTAIVSVVIWATWRTGKQSFAELARSGVSWRDLHFGWLAFSAIVHVVAMIPMAWFWHHVVVSMNQHPSLGQSMRAYFISQPGKYVPGKFMVVLLRTMMIRQARVHDAIAVASIFIETLTVMSIGAVLGGVIVAITFSGDWWLLFFAIAASIGVGAPAFPPVFRMAIRITRVHRLHPEIDDALAGLTISSLLPSWGMVAIGWILMGISLWATVLSLPPIEARPEASHASLDIVYLTASVALSTVAGFVSGLPGGLGARELVVAALMKAQFGATTALLSAVLHRCVMIVAEVGAAAILYFLGRGAEVGPSTDKGVASASSSAGE